MRWPLHNEVFDKQGSVQGFWLRLDDPAGGVTWWYASARTLAEGVPPGNLRQTCLVLSTSDVRLAAGMPVRSRMAHRLLRRQSGRHMLCLNDSKAGGAIHGRPAEGSVGGPRLTPAALLIDRLMAATTLTPGPHLAGLHLVDETTQRELLAVWVIDAAQRCSDLLFTDNGAGQIEPILREHGRRFGVDVRDSGRVHLHDAAAVLGILGTLGRLPVYPARGLRLAGHFGWHRSLAGSAGLLCALLGLHVHIHTGAERLRLEKVRVVEGRRADEEKIAARFVNRPQAIANALSADLISWVGVARKVHRPGTRVVLRSRQVAPRIEIHPVGSSPASSAAEPSSTQSIWLLLDDPSQWEAPGSRPPRLIRTEGSHAAHLEYDLARTNDRLSRLLAP